MLQLNSLRDEEQCSGFVCHCCRLTECFVSADHPVNSPEAYESRYTYLFYFILNDICNFHLFIVKARELRQQIRHKEDESLFQLGLQDAGELTHGIWRTFDKVQ